MRTTKDRRTMRGQLLDEGNEAFRATFLMKSTRSIVGWALSKDPDTDELQTREQKLLRHYRSAQGFIGRDVDMCLAVHLLLGTRFISDPASLEPSGGLIAVPRHELNEAMLKIESAHAALGISQ
jgi:hypothetical protein